MELRGYWSKKDWPCLYAQIQCKTPYFRGYVDFVLDTGSGRTILGQLDCARLGVKYERLNRDKQDLNLAGFVGKAYIIPNVSIRGRGGPSEDSIEALAIPPIEETGKDFRLPSILGRDFLRRYNVVFKHDFGEIVLTDQSIVLGPS